MCIDTSVSYCRSQEEKEMIWKLECALLAFIIIYVWWTYRTPYFLLLMLMVTVWYTQPMITANIRYGIHFHVFLTNSLIMH